MKPRTYVLVWLALVALATISLVVAQAPIGEWAIVVALVIASVKAGLVLAYFMHLAHGDPLHRFVIGVAIGFLVLLALGVLADVGWRSAASAYVDDVGRP
jgi:cytochrome c oxidase subunit 4